MDSSPEKAGVGGSIPPLATTYNQQLRNYLAPALHPLVAGRKKAGLAREVLSLGSIPKDLCAASDNSD